MAVTIPNAGPETSLCRGPPATIGTHHNQQARAIRRSCSNVEIRVRLSAHLQIPAAKAKRTKYVKHLYALSRAYPVAGPTGIGHAIPPYIQPPAAAPEPPQNQSSRDLPP